MRLFYFCWKSRSFQVNFPRAPRILKKTTRNEAKKVAGAPKTSAPPKTTQAPKPRKTLSRQDEKTLTTTPPAAHAPETTPVVQGSSLETAQPTTVMTSGLTDRLNRNGKSR